VAVIEFVDRDPAAKGAGDKARHAEEMAARGETRTEEEAAVA
jgi:hypothetical protein